MFSGAGEIRALLLARPENYKPAAIAMARLMNTEPALLRVEDRQLLPNWTPPEIGKLGPLDLIVRFDVAAMSTTGGLDEFNGYRVERDAEYSTDKTDGFKLTVDFGFPKPVTTYSFGIPKDQGYTEEELFRGGLAELDRRIAARAARTDPAVSYGMDDPVADRRRLIEQHSEIAKSLGLSAPEAPTTQTTQNP